MSRIGKQTISLPDKVRVNVGHAGQVSVEGPKGKLEWSLPNGITARLDGTVLEVLRQDDSRQQRALHGLSRSLVHNMITGVNTGFKKDLEIQGVGFKAAVQGSILNLSLGKSHPINFPIPEGIQVTVSDNTKIAVQGIDCQKVGQVAADIRAYYPPEPYKGKGVRYAGENVIRKEGKTVQ